MKNIYHGANTKFVNLLGTKNKHQWQKIVLLDIHHKIKIYWNNYKIKYLLGIKNIFKPLIYLKE